MLRSIARRGETAARRVDRYLHANHNARVREIVSPR
jgi:hypothetical protein